MRATNIGYLGNAPPRRNALDAPDPDIFVGKRQEPLRAPLRLRGADAAAREWGVAAQKRKEET
jgi:hypothetical protein